MEIIVIYIEKYFLLKFDMGVSTSRPRDHHITDQFNRGKGADAPVSSSCATASADAKLALRIISRAEYAKIMSADNVFHSEMSQHADIPASYIHAMPNTDNGTPAEWRWMMITAAGCPPPQCGGVELT